MKEILFYIVIFLSNIIQGITGFAGTILAMPFGIMLVGYNVAKPVLNILGLLSGIYIFMGNRKYINWKEFCKVVFIMAVGIIAGVGIKQLLTGQEEAMYKALGVFIILLSAQGFYRLKYPQKSEKYISKKVEVGKDLTLLVGAGIVHGIFVSGGPLLIGYLAKKLQDKQVFRATISTVWIILNALIMIDDIYSGLWTIELVKTQMISIPFLLIGMFIGEILYKKISRRLFVILTYVLLTISGFMLLIK